MKDDYLQVAALGAAAAAVDETPLVLHRMPNNIAASDSLESIVARLHFKLAIASL